MEGYAGKILHVDLATGKTHTESLEEPFVRSYIGGFGLGMALLLKYCPRKVNPFSPDNPLILATGPFSGTLAPSGSGHVFMAKSPQTLGVGLSKAYGHFGAELKRAGYDAIVFRGRSERPVYVWIDDDSIQILSAEHLWGSSPIETEEAIREELGDYGIRVASIGVAGEKLAGIAAIVSDKTRVAARMGLGGVMGSKNLKAIAVRGTNNVTVLDLEGFKEFAKALIGMMKARDVGKNMLDELFKLNAMHALPTRNYNNAYFEAAEAIRKALEHYPVNANSCNSCPIGCEHIYSIQYGPYAGTKTRIEFGPLWAMGPYCGVDHFDAVAKAIELCNYYGLDAISAGVSVAFAMECYEKGILGKKEMDGVDARFGNPGALLELIHKMGNREGIGKILSEGVQAAAQHIGAGSEKLAQHIKGVEVTGYDLRALKPAALACAVSFRGDHTSGLPPIDTIGNNYTADVARQVKDNEDLYALMDSLLICKFTLNVYSDIYSDLSRLYMLVTGYELSPQELKMVGERVINLARLFNIREGLGREKDHLPWKVMNLPISDEGPTEGAFVSQRELDMMLDDYYYVRGWSGEGVPTVEKLRMLGLEDFITHTLET